MDSKIQEILEDSKAYASHQIELAKLKLAEKVAFKLADLLSGTILIYAGVLFLLFVSIAGGLLFGDLVNNYGLGFLIVAGIYLILFLILYSIRNTALKRSLTNFSIKKMFENDES